MKFLIVSATRFEIEPFFNKMDSINSVNSNHFFANYKHHQIDFLITGVGMVATAFYLAKMLSNNYDFAINAGICGSFNKNIDVGTVVNIYEDIFSELGAEDGESFLTLEELKLPGTQKVKTTPLPFKNNLIELLPKVTGVTVNTTHGNEKSIEKVVQLFHPFVESMEGAAFIYSCEKEKTPCIQLRAVSNYVEKRNKEAWNIPLAIENLNTHLIAILNDFN
ncbi:MAG: futalosine hydrolase [Bacteroidia bacterium]|nr:futalosine hydrolase [Bacteroidia bacterium]